MASPFRVFRKNQKVWMAGITIMAIVAFVFLSGPMIGSFSGSGGRDAPVVRTKFGNLSASELATIRGERTLLHGFLTRLGGQLYTNQQAVNNLTGIMRLLGNDSEEAAIDSWVYARTAESMGIIVDETTVKDFLTALTTGSPEPQKAIDAALGKGERAMSPDQLVSILKKQLLGLRLRHLGHQFDPWAAKTATPGERWDYFKRLKEKATVEVALLLPQDFVKDVKDPSEDTLKDFFEKHKAAESSPESPKPGFRVPRKVKLEYLEADPEKYETQVSEAEITQEYEKDPKKYARDKEDFEKEEKQEREARAKEEKEAAGKSTPEKKSETEVKKNETKPEAKPEAKPQAKPETKPETKPAAKPETKPETTPATKTDAKPETKPETKPAEKPAPAGGSSVAPQSPFRLVAFADDKPGEKKDASVKPTDGAKPASDVHADSNAGAKPQAKTEVKPADDKKPTEKKPADGTKPTEEKKTGTEKQPAAGSEKKEAATKKEAPIPIKTAEERLRDMIRQELAGRKFQENVAKIKALLDGYRSEWVNYDAEVKSNPDMVKPTPPDFAALAKQYMMTAHSTGLISQRELFETDLGKSVQNNMELGRQTYAFDQIFGPTTLYKVDTSVYSTIFPTPKRVEFIFWKIDDQAGGVPKWDDPGIDTEVLKAWKFVEARKLAQDAAEKLKAEASAAPGKPLKDFVVGRKEIEILKPKEFTWLTSMYQGTAPTISEVGDLTHLGADFMRKVFSLKPGQMAVATNRPRSEIYVVRMIGLTPFADLWDKFTSGDSALDYDSIMEYEMGTEVSRAWKEAIYAEAGVKIEKPATRDSAPSRDVPDTPDGPPPPEEL